MTITPPTIASALFRHPAIFCGTLLAALGLAAAASVLPTPVWRVHAAMVVPQSSVDPLVLLNDPDLQRQALARAGSAGLYPDLDQPAAEAALAGDLKIHRSQSEVIEVTLDGRNPAGIVQALDTLLQGFGERRALSLADERRRTLDEQARHYRQAAEESQRRLNDFRQANKLWSVDDERRQLQSQHDRIDGDLKHIGELQDDLAARIGAMKVQLEETPATLQPTDQSDHYKMVDDAKARLLELQLKEQELLAKYTETSQFVVTVRDEIRRVQAYLDEMSETINRHSRPVPNDAYTDLSRALVRFQSQMSAAQERRTALEGQMAAVDSRLQDINGHEAELHVLEQAKADNEAALRGIENARLDHAVEQGKALVFVERPTLPTAPIRPQPLLYFALALPVGLLGGVGAALAADALSGTFATPDDVERRLGLPVLAALRERP